MDENSFSKQPNGEQNTAPAAESVKQETASTTEPLKQEQASPSAPTQSGAALIAELNASEEQKPATEPKEASTPVTKPKKNNRTTMFLVAVLLLVILGAGGVVFAMNWDAWFGNKTSEPVSEDLEGGPLERRNLENTDLSANTVTTTIDGKQITYSAAYVVDGVEATIGSGTFESSKDNETVFLVINGGKLVIDGDNVVINKTGSENFDGRGDDYSFYGINSAIVVVGENSKAEIYGGEINTSVNGANAVFAIDGGHISLIDSVIKTTKDNSRGVHASFGGTYEGYNVTITTMGASSATIATDRGSGVGKLNQMTLETNGAGSPLIYSTGTISIADSTGVANGAQIAVIEGSNSISINNCEFKTNGIGNRNGVDNAGIMIYQSMSGDAAEGEGTLSVYGSDLTVMPESSVYDSVPFIFVTNTTANVKLMKTNASFSEKSVLISAIGTNEWGRAGANGGIVTFSATDLEATNTEVTVDSISSVTDNN